MCRLLEIDKGNESFVSNGKAPQSPKGLRRFGHADSVLVFYPFPPIFFPFTSGERRLPSIMPSIPVFLLQGKLYRGNLAAVWQESGRKLASVASYDVKNGSTTRVKPFFIRLCGFLYKAVAHTAHCLNGTRILRYCFQLAPYPFDTRVQASV